MIAAARSDPGGVLIGARPWNGWALPCCVLLAAALRVAAVLVVSHPEIRRAELSLSSDEPSFHETAQAVATTGRYSQRPGGPATAFRPPGIILPLAALYALVQPTPYVALAYVLLCGLGVVVATYGLAYATWRDDRVAVAAALLAATMPTSVFTSSGIWSEPQAILLTLLLLHMLIRREADGAGSRNWALIGLCGSLAYLTRPSAGFVFPFLIGAALVSRQGWKRTVNGMLLIGALTLPIGLWGVRNWLTFGEFITGATVAGEALYGSNNPVTAGQSLPAKQVRGPFDLYEEAREGRYLGSWVPMQYIPGWEAEMPADAPELTVYHRQMESAMTFIRREPWSGLRLLGYKLVRLLTLEPYAPSVTNDVGIRRIVHRIVTVVEHWFIVGWGVAGMLQMFLSGHRARYWYCCFVAAGLANVLVTYANPRFLFPLTSVLVVPAALALTRAYDTWCRKHAHECTPARLPSAR